MHYIMSRCSVLTGLCLLVSAVMLSGCTEVSLFAHTAKQYGGPQTGTSKPTGTYKIGRPYQIAGVWYHPKVDPAYDETGIASWYGVDFHGKRTANGDIYDMNALTAAHRTLPMPTRVRVTNLENGRSILVTINDRGPFARGRIIDLSRRAAQLLGMQRQGTARVRVQIAEPPGTPETVVAERATTPQPPPAMAALPQGAINAQGLPDPGGSKTGASPIKATNSSEPVQMAAAEPSVMVPSEVTVVPAQATDIYIQAGAFSDLENADRLNSMLSDFGPTQITQVLIDNRNFYRVRIGPVASVESADRLLEELIRSGHNSARIVVE